uniref:Uncharacterized protein n=1 Tax=Arundo donax TaxID=35708 RepID=A0A0A9DQB3_ARUDO
MVLAESTLSISTESQSCRYFSRCSFSIRVPNVCTMRASCFLRLTISCKSSMQVTIWDNALSSSRGVFAMHRAISASSTICGRSSLSLIAFLPAKSISI